MSIVFDYTPVRAALAERVIDPNKSYDPEKPWEKNRDNLYGLKEEELEGLEKRLTSLPIESKKGFNALLSLVSRKDRSVRTLADNLEELIEDEQLFFNVKSVLANPGDSFDKFLANANSAFGNGNWFLEYLDLFCKKKEFTKKMHKSALRLARSKIRSTYNSKDNKSKQCVYEYIGAVIKINPPQRFASILRQADKIGWQEKYTREEQQLAALYAANYLDGRDLTRSEFEFLKEALPLIFNKKFIKGTGNLEVGELYVGGRVESYALQKIIRIFGGKILNEFGDTILDYISWDYNGEIRTKLLSQGKIDEKGFPTASLQKKKRNQLELLRAYLLSPSDFILSESLEEFFIEFGGASKSVIDIIKADITNGKSGKLSSYFLPGLHYLLTLDERSLKIIKEISQSGKLIYDSYDEINAILKAPKKAQRFLIGTYIDKDPFASESLNDVSGLITAFAEDTTFVHDLTYLIDGKSKRLSLAKWINYLKEKSKSYFYLGPYTAFHDFLTYRSKLKEDQVLCEKTAKLFGLNSATLDGVLPELRNRYGENAINYFNAFLSVYEKLGNPSENSRKVLDIILNKKDDSGKFVYPAERIRSALSYLRDINNAPKELFDILEGFSKSDYYISYLGFISSFYSQFSNFSENSRTKMISHIMKEESHQLMNRLFQNRIESAEIEKYVEGLSVIPTIGVKGQVDMLYRLNTMMSKLGNIDGINDEENNFSWKRNKAFISMVIEAISAKKESAHYKDYDDIRRFVTAYEQVREKYGSDAIPALDLEHLKSVIEAYGAYDSGSIFKDRVANLNEGKKSDKSLTGLLNQMLKNDFRAPAKMARKIAREFFETLDSRTNIGKYNFILHFIDDIYFSAYDAILGEKVDRTRLKITEDLENIIIGYLSTSYREEIRPIVKKILTAYTKAVMEKIGEKELNEILQKEAYASGIIAMNEIIDGLEGNKSLLEEYRKKGIKAELWNQPFSRTYELEKIENPDDVRKKNIEAELGHIRRCLDEIGYDTANIDDFIVLAKIKDILSSKEFKSAEDDVQEEIKHHVRNIRKYESINLERRGKITFYVSRDPFERFNMGTYVGSCTSLSDGINGYNGFVAGIDVNKQIIYARLEDGTIIGRNLIEITREGIVANEFYDIANLNTDKAWIEFLEEYSRFLGMPLIVPEEFAIGDKRKQLISKEYTINDVTTTLDRAVFSHYYHNGFGGRIDISPEGHEFTVSAYVKV